VYEYITDTSQPSTAIFRKTLLILNIKSIVQFIFDITQKDSPNIMKIEYLLKSIAVLSSMTGVYGGFFFTNPPGGGG